MKCHNIDLLAYQPKILFKGRESMTSIYGAILTLLSFATIAGISLYFFISMLSDKEYSINISVGKTLNNTMPLNQFPIMVRITNYSEVKLEDQDNKVNVTFRNGYGEVNKPFPFRCDINKHFGEEWRYLFKDISELDDYWCFDPADPSVFNITFKQEFWVDALKCKSEKNPTPYCGGYTVDQVNLFLQTTYLHLYTVDFMIDNDDPENPFKPYLFYKKFPISSTLYKQYFLNRKIVEYRSERGLVFSDVKTMVQPVYDFVEWSGDLRYNSKYGQLVMRMSDTYEVRTRNIFKLQNVLANIGGIAKFFLTIFSFFSGIINENFYYYQLAQYFFELEGSKKKVNNAASFNNPNKNDQSYTNKIDINSSNKDLKTIRVNNYTTKTAPRRINMTFLRRIWPSKEQKNLIDFVKERMSVESFMGLYNEFEKVKLCLFTEKELEAFYGLGNFNFKKFEEKRRRSSVFVNKDMTEMAVKNDVSCHEKFQNIKSIIE
jgi:hypothetical protein